MSKQCFMHQVLSSIFRRLGNFCFIDLVYQVTPTQHSPKYASTDLTKSVRMHGRRPEAKFNLERPRLMKYTTSSILASMTEIQGGLRGQ